MERGHRGTELRDSKPVERGHGRAELRDSRPGERGHGGAELRDSGPGERGHGGRVIVTMGRKVYAEGAECSPFTAIPNARCVVLSPRTPDRQFTDDAPSEEPSVRQVRAVANLGGARSSGGRRYPSLCGPRGARLVTAPPCRRKIDQYGDDHPGNWDRAPHAAINVHDYTVP